MKELNATQRHIYEYLNFCFQNGTIPSVREIASEIGAKSTSTVQRHLDLMEEAGYIERDPMLKRSIRIVAGESNSRSAVQVPLLGTVTAGMPVLAQEDIESYITFQPQKACEKPLFALNVKGDSMKDAGILNGDIIIAEQTPYAENGDIVVALLQQEATVKRFYRENGHFRLQPENDNYAPIITDELMILGKVISLVRYYR